MKRPVRLNVNGDLYEVDVEPRESLLDVLRNKVALTGTKKGCNTGDCGACTVILDKRPVNACLVLAVEADGKDILTIEGLAQGTQLHPIQEAFVQYGAVQCGYCTPGMIMSAKALLDEVPSPSDDQIKMAIAGNLCRCTGYVKIIEAIREASKTYRTQS